MILQNLRLVNYKNYEDSYFDFHSKLVVIAGNNGVGKTNLLDAIYYTALGKSYFNATDKQVVRSDCNFFRLDALYNQEGKACRIVAKIKAGQLKEIEVNEAKIAKLSEHIGQVPIVMISPDDVHFLLNGNEERRMFFNNTIVQYDKNYIDHLSMYNKLLKQRNALLKDFNDRRYYDRDLLEIITQSMVAPAQYISKQRRHFANALLPLLQEQYATISSDKEQCRIDYTTQIEEGDFMELSFKNIDKDRILARTSVGIHKDEILFILDDRNIKDHASQGQLKSYILALKLAQFFTLKKVKTALPIVLLDDVFDKLDPTRVSMLLHLVSGDDFGQVFITDTHVGRVDDVLKGFDNVQQINMP